ncbi:sepiapterin reductase-like [Culicoides brevitarsis]|uniref:sepiapterin reductase-like n=1 Tax=Culicoides brevitarsis TaxID=469753 RepID=UPI00307B2C6E
MSALNFSKISHLIVTGASRGIGRALAIEFSRKLPSGSRISIAARDSERLETVKNEILSCNSKVDVVPHALDLGNCSSKDLRALCNAQNGSSEQGIIIHNVGTTGDVSKKAKDCNDLSEWETNFRLNVFNVALLNNIFMQEFKEKRKFVYNLSAKAAFVPFESFGIYCPNKAARHMYFKVLAEEEKRDKNLTILQFYPGPVDTDMLANMETHSCSPMLRNFFKAGKAKNQISSPETTAKQFLEICEKGNFKSGDFMDYHAAKIDVKV